MLQHLIIFMQNIVVELTSFGRNKLHSHHEKHSLHNSPEASSSNSDSGIFMGNESMMFHSLSSQDSPHVSSLSSIQERRDGGYISLDYLTSEASSSLVSSKRLETAKQKSTTQLGAASRGQMQSLAGGKLKKEPVKMVLGEPITEMSGEDSEVSEMETSNKVLTLATTSTSNSGAAGPPDKTQTVVDLVSFKDRYVQHCLPR